MSLNAREIEQLVAVTRDVVALIDATTIAITDITQTRLTRNQLATLINRYYNETPGVGTPPALAES